MNKRKTECRIKRSKANRSCLNIKPMLKMNNNFEKTNCSYRLGNKSTENKSKMLTLASTLSSAGGSLNFKLPFYIDYPMTTNRPLNERHLLNVFDTLH